VYPLYWPMNVICTDIFFSTLNPVDAEKCNISISKCW
jgi:hypothetical protein